MLVQSDGTPLAAGPTKAENGSQLTVSQLAEVAVENVELRARVARAEADHSVRAFCHTGPAQDPCMPHAAMPDYLACACFQSLQSWCASNGDDAVRWSPGQYSGF